MRQYTIESFHQLMQDDTLTFSLSEDVLNVLEYLEKVIEVPEIITEDYGSGGHRGGGGRGGGHGHPKSPNEYKKKMGGGGGGNGGRNHNKMKKINSMESLSRGSGGGDIATASSSGDGENWEMMRSFKSTVFEKKTGIDKIIDDVRINLNKMSHTTFEKQKNMILEIVRAYFTDEENCTEENTHKICNTIFEIASTNKFFSELYVQIYSVLITEYSIFGKYVDVFVEEFDKTMQNIHYVDPDVNYDGFCLYTKANEKRQSTTTFVVNMMKRGLVKRERVIGIIRDFMDAILKMIVCANNTKEVEEIVENIFILYTNAYGAGVEKSESALWESINGDVQKLGQSFSKEYLSLSNRAIFKFMDMMELVE